MSSWRFVLCAENNRHGLEFIMLYRSMYLGVTEYHVILRYSKVIPMLQILPLLNHGVKNVNMM